MASSILLHLVVNGVDQGPLPSAQRITVSPVDSDFGSISFDYPINGKRYAKIKGLDEFEVVPVIDGIRYERLGGIVQETSGDDVAEAGVRQYSGLGYLQFIAEARAYPFGWPSYDAENPSWKFVDKTAGEIVGALLTAAQARGGLQGVTWAFTNTKDTAGNDWLRQVTLEILPSANLVDVLKSLHGQGMCDFRMNGRVLEMHEFGTLGLDRTQQVRPLTFRKGRDAVDSPRKTSTREVATAVLGAGKDDTGLFVERTSPDGIASRRRIEDVVSNGNITEAGTLAAFTELSLSQRVNPKMEKTHGLVYSNPKSPRPLRDFDVSDWVFTDVGLGLERYRVKQWVLTQNDDGTVSGSVTLNDLFAEAEEKLAKRIDGIIGGSTVTGESRSEIRVPNDLVDGIAPSTPTSLNATSDPYTDAGQTYAQVTASWAQVTTNVDGTICEDLRGYQVRWSTNPTEIPDPVTDGSVPEDRWQQLLADGWSGPTAAPSAPVQAAQEYAARLASGLPVAEDFSYAGMSPVVQIYQEQFADQFYADNPGTDWPTPGVDRAREWFRKYIQTNGPRPPIIYHPLYGQTAWRYVPESSGETVSWSPLAAGIPIYLQVRAVDKAGNTSAWSPRKSILTGVDITPPAPPAAPAVDNYLGLLRITWSGLAASGAAVAADTSRTEVHVSQTNNFIPSPDTLHANMITAGSVFYDAPYGVTHYVRLVSVDTQGNRSDPSAVGYGSTGQVVSADVFDGAIGSAKLADLAVITAKIGDLAVNNAKIGSMEVGKLTAGTLTAVVVLGERITTALTGQRTEQNPLGFYGWDAAENLTLKLDGVDNVITGTLNTAVSGRRVIVGNQTASTGRVSFVAPDGRYGRIRGFTQSEGLEALRLEIFNGTALSSWINLNTEDYTSYRARVHEFQLVGNPSKAFRVFTDSFQRFFIDSDGYQFTAPGGVSQDYRNSNLITWSFGTGLGQIKYISGSADLSPAIQFITGPGYADCAIRAYSSASRQEIEVVNHPGSAYMSMRAAAFNVSSDEAVKKSIRSVSTADMLADVVGTQVKRYVRKGGPEKGREEIGLIAQQAPERIVTTGAEGMGLGIDLYQMLALAWGAIQELNGKLNRLENA